jgi:RNA polymerase III RPC4
MAPPPSQAGKFKPRKPAQAIAVSSGNPAVPSSSRGRRRSPAAVRVAPQGKAYFTAQPAGRVAVTGPPRQEVDEEIVGTLDQAVGATISVSAAQQRDAGTRPVASAPFSERAGGSAVATAHLPGSSDGGGYMYYDSDSSMEYELALTRDTHGSVPRPLTLPLIPPVGNSDENEHAALEGGFAATSQHGSNSVQASLPNQNREPSFIPAANEWCLVQLPTRLPFVLPTKNESDAEEVKIVETASVATPPIQEEAFDNALLQARAPGRLGRILVYASGRTVFVTDDDEEGTPVRRLSVAMVLYMPFASHRRRSFFATLYAQVVLNVSKGLQCEFQQQVVEINLPEQTYTPLGLVQHTWVMTPDLSEANAAVVP